MIDAALIHKCADPDLKPAIVERFIAEAGSDDPLAVTVRSGERIVLVPPVKTPDEAVALAREYVGKAAVRAGVTQYPAGLGIRDAAELKPDLFEPCANIRMGTALFGKVYRIVTKWYGAPADEAFDDAIDAWRSGYFDDKYVFGEPDPGNVDLSVPTDTDHTTKEERAPGEWGDAAHQPPAVGDTDPNHAGIRVDVSRIGGQQ